MKKDLFSHFVSSLQKLKGTELTPGKDYKLEANKKYDCEELIEDIYQKLCDVGSSKRAVYLELKEALTSIYKLKAANTYSFVVLRIQWAQKNLKILGLA